MNQIFLFLIFALLLSVLGFVPTQEPSKYSTIDLKKPQIHYLKVE